MHGRCVFVELLLAHEALGSQRGRAVVLLPSENEVRFGRADIIGGYVDLFLADPGEDVVAVGARLAHGCPGLVDGGGQFRTAQHGQQVALADLLASGNQHRLQPPGYVGGDVNLGFANRSDERRFRGRARP